MYVNTFNVAIKFVLFFRLLAEICLCSEAFQRMEQSMTKPKFPVVSKLLIILINVFGIQKLLSKKLIGRKVKKQIKTKLED